MYKSYTDVVTWICEGNVQAADYFMNCSIYEYYYRLDSYDKYVAKHNEQMKQAFKK